MFNINLLHQLPPLGKPVFLYLSEIEWASTWTDGGKIPISPASTYKSDIRVQTGTPDELDRISTFGFSNGILEPVDPIARAFAIDFAKTSGVGRVMFGDNISIEKDGQTRRLAGHVEYIQQDSLILSFSSVLSAELAARLGKKAVVRINDPIKLFELISDQLGVRGKFDFVEYTKGPVRNEYLKSEEDAWQHEVRMNWDSPEPKVVTVGIQQGTSEFIDLSRTGNPQSLQMIPFPSYDSRIDEENRLFRDLSFFAALNQGKQLVANGITPSAQRPRDQSRPNGPAGPPRY